MRTKYYLPFLFCLTLIAMTIHGSEAKATNLESIQLATALGSLLAGEEECDLNYNHEAIERYIDKNVESTDMSFTMMLQGMSDGVEFGFSEMTDSEKAAFCHQTERAAKAHGFITDSSASPQ